MTPEERPITDPQDRAAERLEVVEERLLLGKREEERVVRIHQRPTERTERVSVPLEVQQVELERVPVGRFVDEIPPVREEDGVTIIPVVEEVVTTRLRLVEEVRVVRRSRQTVYEGEVTLRRTDIQVEDVTPEGSAP